MKEPVWVEKGALVLLHLKALARFGGAEGVRDEGMLDSVFERPRNAFQYDGQKEIAALAASYAFGLIKNHPFVDGSKRMAFMAIGIFLDANECVLKSGSVDAIQAVTALAGGKIGEEELVAWLRQNMKRG